MPTDSAERTVTTQMTLPPQTQTWALEEVHSTTLVRETLTVTVPGTVRVTHTVTVDAGE